MAFVALVVTDKRVLTHGKVLVRPETGACRATTARLSSIRIIDVPGHTVLAPLQGAALPLRGAVRFAATIILALWGRTSREVHAAL
jgi:hypothetical protein